MRRAALAVPLLGAAPAAAHVGHLGDLAGHDHWLAGAAIGAAVLAGLWGAWKASKEPQADDPEAEDPAEPEAPA